MAERLTPRDRNGHGNGMSYGATTYVWTSEPTAPDVISAISHHYSYTQMIAMMIASCAFCIVVLSCMAAVNEKFRLKERQKC